MRFSFINLVNRSSLPISLEHVKGNAPFNWQSVKTTNKEVIYEKLAVINNWYTKIIGLDEVKIYQDRVVELQERLLETQEKRRDISRQLSEVRAKSSQIQDEMHKVRRTDNMERFYELMAEDRQILILENSVSKTFQEYDQAERELFAAFSNAIRDSYEKQRAQLEYTKYFGIILSITGSFLAFCYSSIKKDDLKKFIVANMADKEPKDNQLESMLKVFRSEAAKLMEIAENQYALNKEMIKLEDVQKLKEIVENQYASKKEMIKLGAAQKITINEPQSNASILPRPNWYYVGATAILFILFKGFTG